MTTGKKYQPNVHGKIAKLIAERQADIDALMRAGALLNGVAKNGKVHGSARLVAEAIALDAERRVTKQEMKKSSNRAPYSQGGASAAKMKKNRKATAVFLKKVAESDGPYKPTGKDKKKTSVLIQHKYIKPQGEGYVRTDKVFTA